jgi:hypothetical protein
VTEPKGRPHPSGRPVHERIVKGHPILRVSEQLVSRLREPAKGCVEAIGFMHFTVNDGDEDLE